VAMLKATKGIYCHNNKDGVMMDNKGKIVCVLEIKQTGDCVVIRCTCCSKCIISCLSWYNGSQHV